MAINAPTDVATLFAWWDFSDAGTLYDATTGGSAVAADSNIARIEDKSGNSHHMVENSSGSGPTRKIAVQNGLDTGRFNGANEWLISNEGAATWQFLGSGAQTVFISFKPTVADRVGFLFGTTASVASDGYGSYGRWDDRSSSGFSESLVFAAKTSSSFVLMITNHIALLDNWSILGWYYNADNTDINTRAGFASLLGRLAGINSQSSNTKDTTTLTRTARIGAGQDSGGTSTWFLAADVGEIIVYNSRLSSADALLISEYLFNKWRPPPISGANTASVTLPLTDPASGGSAWVGKSGLAVDVSVDRDSAPFYSATGQSTNGAGELSIVATGCPLAAGTRTVWIRVTDSDGTAGSSGNDSNAFYSPVEVTVS